jgi:hypothetical protein
MIVHKLVPRQHERYDGLAHVFDAQFPEARSDRGAVEPVAFGKGCTAFLDALDLQFLQSPEITLQRGESILQNSSLQCQNEGNPAV